MNFYTTSGKYSFATQRPTSEELAQVASGRAYLLKIYFEGGPSAIPVFRVVVELPPLGRETDEIRDVVIPGLNIAADPLRWDHNVKIDPIPQAAGDREAIEAHGKAALEAAYTNLLIRRWLLESP